MRYRIPLARAVALAAGLSALAGCGTDPGDGGGNGGGTPAIAVTISTNALTIQQGGNGTLTATITRSGGFTGAVNITTEGAPAGVTAATSNVSTSGGTTTGTVTVSVAGSVAPGTYNLTIRATGSGVADKTVAFTLTVTAPPPAASIELSLNPTSLALSVGGAGSSIVSIARTNFTGEVTFTIEGLPAGMTAAFAPPSTTTNSTNLSIQVGAVAIGSYPLTVRGSGTGITAKTATLTVTVSAGTPTPAIALAANPATLSLTTGTQGSLAVGINRTNFTGAVTLALENLPTGVTGAFNPNGTTANSSTLTITVGAATVPGVYTVTVRGTGTGITAATTTFELTVLAPASFAITTIAPDPLNIAQGTAAPATITLARTNFTGTINLTVEGLPTGATGAFSPAAATANSSTLTVTVGVAVVPGNYTVTVRGAATGLTDQTKTFTLTVTASVQGSYTLSTTPPTQVSIQQGGSSNVTVNVNRLGGFTGTVALTVTGAPAGLTANVTPANATGATSTLALQAAGGLAVGAYPLTIRGTTAGLADQTVVLTVNVTAPAGGGNVTLNFSTCDVEDRPIWFAFQDGNGAWTQVVGNNNVYTFNIGSSRGGFAFVLSPSVSTFGVTVQYYTQAEVLGVPPGSYCGTNPATKSLMATVAGLTGTQGANLSLGGGSGASFGNGPVTINGVRNGTFDLFGYARDLLAPGAGDRVVVRRGINTAALAPGASIGAPVDFATEGVAAASATFTVTNPAGGESLLPSMLYYAGAACDAAVLYSSTPVASVFTAYGIPAGSMLAGEAHTISLSASGAGGSSRLLMESFGALSARSLTLPSALPVFTPTVEAGPYKRLRTQYTMPADLNASLGLFYSDAGGGRVVTVGASLTYMGGTAIDLGMPDFSTVAGWSNTWAPTAGSNVNWVASGTALGAAGAGCAISRLATSSRSGMI